MSDELRTTRSFPLEFLPLELQISILAASMAELDHNEFRERRGLLRLVCRSWANIVNTAPEFWCKLSSEWPIGINRRSFKKAGRYLLDIRWNYTQTNATEFLHIVLPALARWRTAYILFTADHVKLLGSLWTGAAPKLIALEVVADLTVSSHSVTHCLQLLQGGAERLRELEVNFFNFYLDSPALQGLTSFDWHDPNRTCSVRPNTTWFMNILANSPFLRRLSVIGISQEMDTPQTQSPPIYLPHLTTIELEDLPFNFAFGVIRNITAPACNNFAIDWREGTAQDEAQVYERGCLAGFMGWWTCLKDETWVSVNLEEDLDGTIRIHVRADFEPREYPDHPKFFFFMFCPSTTVTQAMKWLIAVLESCPIPDALQVSLDFYGGIVFENEGFLQSILEFPHKVDVTIRARADAEAFLEWSGASGQGKNMQWRLPKLCKLTIHNDALDVSELYMIMRRRYGSTAGDNTWRPMQLEVLDVPMLIRTPGMLNELSEFPGIRHITNALPIPQ